MPGFSPQGIFLSYRRDDAGPSARSLQLQLSQRIPDAPIFMDLDSIEPGLDFAEVIEEKVNSCAVLVALIGRQWATLTDEEGTRRLDNPDDYVRFEVKTALERGVRVIPVLVDGARPLRQQELPGELRKLARLEAAKLSWDRYQDDSDRLLELIQRVLAAAGERAEAERRAQEDAERKAQKDAGTARDGAGTAVREIADPGIGGRSARGLEARDRASLLSHTKWTPAADRPDPVALLKEQDITREPDLVPVRHGRMMVSPFTFYRGAAKIMAADLKDTPVAGLDVQLCGDAHLSNFGVFTSPERRLLFDLNDFDETLPGPFEYDVKRMAASCTIAARNNGFSKADARAATMASVTAYREAMAGFAQMGTMDIWYAHLDADELMAVLGSTVAGTKKEAKSTKKVAAKTLSRLGEVVDGKYRIVSRPPILVPARDLASTYGLSPNDVMPVIHEQFRVYRATLQDDARRLLERFEIVDVARRVVGVGSVGTWAFVVLLQRRDAQDPLFLQVKEATVSVLEAYVGKSRYRQHGERVVQGQRMMQAASDIYLGWSEGLDVGRHFYWRQLRDMKGSALLEAMIPTGLTHYARICGWTLARAHARSGDPVAMAEYLGEGDEFDRSITDFSERYADQNERDYQEFVKAIRSGRLPAVEGV